MRILHTVESYAPSVGGMQEVVKQLSERLAQLGHDVTVATSRMPERSTVVLNGVTIQEFSVSGNMVRGIEGESEAYQRFLLESGFDVVANFAAQQWATDLALPILNKIRAKKVFVPTGFSGLYVELYRDYFAQMAEWMHQYDMNVFLSDDYRDVNFAKEHGLQNWTLIPNGAGADEFERRSSVDIRSKLRIPENHFLVLHVGSHTGAKGHAEAISIFREANIPGATFLLVGNAIHGGCARACKRKNFLYKLAPPLLGRNKRLVVTELSREDTVAAYHQADLFLFPSNIECSPLVLFECMASRTAFLATDVGNVSEIIRWSNAGYLLPTAKSASLEEADSASGLKGLRGHYPGCSIADVKASARLLEATYHEVDERTKMGERGHRVWRERFTWEVIAKQYERLYQNLLGLA